MNRPLQTTVEPTYQSASISDSGLVFIDSHLDDYPLLVSGILPGLKTILLKPDTDGVFQITEALQNHSSQEGLIQQIHILSHGGPGSFQVGSLILNLSTLETHKKHLREWKTFLAQDADILLYGCQVAQGKGTKFIEKLSHLTGANIAASYSKVGNRELGGYWQLDFHVGNVKTPLALYPEMMLAYQGVFATITVTNLNDNGAGSLRNAIASASPGDTIIFDPSLANQTINLSSGQLIVNKDITIDGSNATGLIISGNNASRVIDMQNAITFTLKNVTIANGKLTGTDEATGAGAGIRGSNGSTLTLDTCTFKNNIAGFGGAIYTGFQSTNIVTNSTFNSNDGTLAKSERGGGAIATKSAGSLTVTGSTFTNNKGINGGAINNLLGQLTVNSCTFTNNDTTAGASGTGTFGYGGAIYTDGANASGPGSTPGSVGGNITILKSNFTGNKGAGQGGGLFLFVYSPDQIMVDGCQVINNQVIKDAKGDSLGGGIRLGNGNYTIQNTTFSNNLALIQGGGLWVGDTSPGKIINTTFSRNKAYDINSSGQPSGLGGAITFSTSSTTNIINSTIANNNAGFQGGGFWGGGSNVTLTNTIVANNTANNGGNSWNIKQHTGSVFNDGGGNLQWPAKNPTDSSDINVTANVKIADPKLGLLQDNGGGILTYALLTGSPAIDTGVSTGVPATDERGISRPQDGDGNGSAIADIGAYELSLTPTPTPTPTPVGTPTPTPVVIPTPTPISTPSPPISPVPTPIDDCFSDKFTTPELQSLENDGGSILSSRFIPNEVIDTINGTEGDDSLIGTENNNAIVGFGGNDTLMGEGGNDNLYGGDNQDLLYGGTGNDFLDGGSGNDTIFGGKDDDIILGMEGQDFLRGDLGNDTIDGGFGPDTIFGGKGNDLIMGGEGQDILYGDFGDDTLAGGSGNDILFGGEGNDFVFGNGGNNILYGGKGNDVICGGSGSDILSGQFGDDSLCGGIGDDTLYGGQGNDFLCGEIGNDFLSGDLGNDTLQGGTGNDTFVLGENRGSDLLLDFQPGIDVIALVGGLKFDQLSLIPDSNSSNPVPTTLIRVTSSGEILASLTGITPSQLTLNSFKEIVFN